jgi:hypothetical protein
MGHPASFRNNLPSGAKARAIFVAFAAVRVKTLTYQSCPEKKQILKSLKESAQYMGEKRGSGDPRYSRPGGRRYSFMPRGSAKPVDY